MKHCLAISYNEVVKILLGNSYHCKQLLWSVSNNFESTIKGRQGKQLLTQIVCPRHPDRNITGL